MDVTLKPKGSPNSSRLPANLQEPSPLEVLQEMERILASSTFQAAEGQRKFLKYAVEEKLAGRGDRIKEYSVGIEVFGRDESFDPRESSIVRSEAKKLRARLAKYYAGEGERDTLRIEFPKGGYSPVFYVASHRSAKEEPQLALAGSWNQLRASAWKHIGLGAALFLVAGLVVYRFAAYQQSAHTTGYPSVVVLPFANLSDDKDESFSDGLADELIDSLTRIPGLHVVGRTSAFQYKGKSLDVRRIGKELGVRAVLAGSVRRYGGRLRITAQLNDASTGYNLWSQSYDRELRDALAIQRDIAGAISNSLGRQLSGQAASAGARGNIDPDAYLEYLKGLYFSNRENGVSVTAAIEHFQQSIAREQGYAPAIAALAFSYTYLPAYSETPVQEVVPKIRETAGRALRLDSTLSQAHRALAWSLVFDYEWRAAEDEFKKAIELSPGEVLAHRDYSHYLERQGRLEEALLEDQKAVALDPVSPAAIQGLARSLYNLRRYDEAIEQCRRATALNPSYGVAHQALGFAYLLKGDYPNAIAETTAARGMQDNDSFTTAQLGYVYAVAGNRDAAGAILNELRALQRNGRFPALALAHVYLGLGETDRAFEWLRKSVEQHDVSVNLRANPLYDRLRSDPRFEQLLRISKLD